MSNKYWQILEFNSIIITNKWLKTWFYRKIQNKNNKFCVKYQEIKDYF